MDRKIEHRREYRQRNFAFWHDYFPSLADYKIYPAGGKSEALLQDVCVCVCAKSWYREQRHVVTFHSICRM